MKIDTPTSTVETQQTTGQQQFQMLASAQAFDLLSSSLYTDKIAAVIRELSCNAADAHALNGNKNTPFDVKLPNTLDAQFYVRDYGPGLSDEDVMQLYTTYFKSTKQNSNEFTGGFGVGSKSPFAYTDSFTVASVHQGVKTIYSAYRDDNGTPMIVRMGASTPSSEPSGLQVGFPVKPQDRPEFAQKAKFIFSWFNTPVNISGQAIEYKDIYYRRNVRELEYAVQQDKKITVSTSQYRTSQLPLVMGNVSYAIAPDMFASDKLDKFKNTHNVMLDMYSALLHRGIILEAPVGTLDVAASRESLAGTKKTYDALEKILKAVYKSYAQNVAREIQELRDKEGDSLVTQQIAQKLLADALKSHSFSPSDTKTFEQHGGIDPELLKWLAPRKLWNDKEAPKTFELLQVPSYLSEYSLKEFLKSGGTLVKELSSGFNGHKLEFFENGARDRSMTYGMALQKCILQSSMASSMRDPRELIAYYVIVPRSKVKPEEYKKERDAWCAKHGISVQALTSIDSPAVESEYMSLQRYSRYRDNYIQVDPATPFIWMSRSLYDEVQKQHRSAHAFQCIEEMLKELRMTKYHGNPFCIVEDADIPKIQTTYTKGLSVQELANEIMQPKIQKRIEAIKPLLRNSSAYLSKLRAKTEKDADWKNALAGTQLGTWVDAHRRMKGGASYASTTQMVLSVMQEVLGKDKFPTVIPVSYDGHDIDKQIKKSYGLVADHFLSRANTCVQVLQELQEYIQWREKNGITPPIPNSAVDALP